MVAPARPAADVRQTASHMRAPGVGRDLHLVARAVEIASAYHADRRAALLDADQRAADGLVIGCIAGFKASASSSSTPRALSAARPWRRSGAGLVELSADACLGGLGVTAG
jgi:hypothetical protein